MSEETLLTKAYNNIRAARASLASCESEDDSLINLVGYHLQQAAELYLKHCMEVNGIEYAHTHDISILLRQWDFPPEQLLGYDWLDDKSEMLTLWESKTRYVKDYLIQYRKVEAALESLSALIDQEMLLEEQSSSPTDFQPMRDDGDREEPDL